jgi:hypothetical protein
LLSGPLRKSSLSDWLTAVWMMTDGRISEASSWNVLTCATTLATP